MGIPVANRTQSEIEPLIGFFVNTLVLRVDLAGEPSFAELVARVRRPPSPPSPTRTSRSKRSSRRSSRRASAAARPSSR